MRGLRVAVIGHRAASCDRRVGSLLWVYGAMGAHYGAWVILHAAQPSYPCVVGSGVFGVQQRPLPLRARVLLGRWSHTTRRRVILRMGAIFTFKKPGIRSGKSGSIAATYDFFRWRSA